MAQVVYAARAFADLERIVGFWIERDPALVDAAVTGIHEAISMLARHPLVGRPVEAGLRELVISRGRTGYVALYRFRKEADLVMVLALRHQREAGYVDSDA